MIKQENNKVAMRNHYKHVITDERREAYEKRMQDYPFCKPCVDCKYWRTIGIGTLNKHTSVKYMSSKGYLSCHSSEPCCHYANDTNKVRGNTFTEDGSCTAFVPKDGTYDVRNNQTAIFKEIFHERRKKKQCQVAQKEP